MHQVIPIAIFLTMLLGPCILAATAARKSSEPTA